MAAKLMAGSSYSSRRESIGSRRAARRAGPAAAARATSASTAAAPSRARASPGSTSKSMERSQRATTTAPRPPATIPIPVQRTANPRVRRAISRGVAPRAIRTPISRRRCATRKESTPNKPMAAKSAPAPAKTASRVA